MKLNRLLLFLCVFGLLLTGCLKKDKGCQYSSSSVVAPQSEQQAVLNYLNSKGITAVLHPSGFYYAIAQAGSGASPGLCSAIRVAYTGKLTDDKVFDSQTDMTFQLGTLIEGWKKGLPLIQKTGRINLYIPPSLGYGPSDIKDNTGKVVIPGNSILIFSIDLLDVQ